ncbi:MAG: hypothetical protein IPM18_00940 [Phycisphaerales bacterium]|nr:hypothetical protein [Phycisphaerales bacterium]
MTTQRTLLFLAALLFSGAGMATAQEERKTADIQVLAIRATTKNTDISPELRSIADTLKRQFRFTGFKLERRAGGSTKIGEAYTTALTGGYTAKITPTRNDGKRITMRVEVLQGSERRLNTTVTVDARRYQLSGGFSLGEGDELIVAVSGA